MESATLARRLFAEAMRGQSSHSDLGRIAVLIAAEDDPDCGIEQTLSGFDALAGQGDDDLTTLSPRQQLEALVHILHGVAGFRGNTKAYYDPCNSLISKVLTRRLGIPLTLALVYMEVARRRGVRLVPIGLPGHLVVRHGDDADVFLDPFAGKVLTEHACLERVLGTERLAHLPAHILHPLDARCFVQRMLANLKGAYLQCEPPDVARAFAACERILLVMPDVPSEVRDRGLLNLHRGQHVCALRDLERYLELCPHAADRLEVSDYVKTLYHCLSHLN